MKMKTTRYRPNQIVMISFFRIRQSSNLSQKMFQQAGAAVVLLRGDLFSARKPNERIWVSQRYVDVAFGTVFWDTKLKIHTHAWVLRLVLL